MSKKATVANLRKQYVDFCYSPLRSDGQIEEDFERLISHPQVTTMCFIRPQVLAIGTTEVVIEYQNREYVIGQFAILLQRSKERKSWQTSFSFLNPSGSISTTFNDLESTYLHPHIKLEYDEYLDLPVGKLCIEQGQIRIYTAIREGKLYTAFILLYRILQMYDAEFPFVKIDNGWGESDEEVAHARRN